MKSGERRKLGYTRVVVLLEVRTGCICVANLEICCAGLVGKSGWLSWRCRQYMFVNFDVWCVDLAGRSGCD